jgi:hypothetical protein
LSYLHRAPSLINLVQNKTKKSNSNNKKNNIDKSENNINNRNKSNNNSGNNDGESDGNNSEENTLEFLSSMKNVLTADDVDAVVVPVSSYIHTFIRFEIFFDFSF